MRKREETPAAVGIMGGEEEEGQDWEKLEDGGGTTRWR